MSICHKKADNAFLDLNLVYRSKMVDFKENHIVPRFLESGTTLTRGEGPTFSRGVQLLIP